MFNKDRDKKRREEQEARERQQDDALIHKATSLINSIVENAIKNGMEKYPLCEERGYGPTVLKEAREAAIRETQTSYRKRQIPLDAQKIRELVEKAIETVAPKLGLASALQYRSTTEQLPINILAEIEIKTFKKYENNKDLQAIPNLSEYIKEMKAYTDPKKNMSAFLDHDFMALYKKGDKFRTVYNRLTQQEEADKEKDNKLSDEQKVEHTQDKGNKP